MTDFFFFYCSQTASSGSSQTIGAKTFMESDGLRAPNEGIDQRNLKIGPMWQTKYASAVPKNLGLGVDFRPCSEGDFLSGRP